ncbi:UPF0641 membrane protein [Yarrowia sp. E02]|nr:UPF0641 membrane protein [Yarrowia sp. E02]
MTQQEREATRAIRTTKAPYKPWISSPNVGLSFVYHLLGFISFASSFHFLEQYPNPLNASYGGKYQYLTILGLCGSYLVFLLALQADVASLYTKDFSNLLYQLKNSVAVAVTPLECVITVLYWSLKLYDPKLLKHPAVKEQIPLWLDMSIHLVPAATLFLDVVLMGQPWNLSFVQAVVTNFGLSAGYWFWVHKTAAVNEFFPYPFLGLVSTEVRVGVFAGAGVIGYVSYIIIRGLQSTFARSPLDQLKGKKSI